MIISDDLKAEIESLIDVYWDSYAQGEWEKACSFFDKSATLIGSSEKEVYHNYNEIYDFFKNTAEEVSGKIDPRNRQLTITPSDSHVLINEFIDLYILSENEWVFYSNIRVSSVLKNTEEGWKFIHQHGSVPDLKAGSDETIAFNQISKENRELRDAIKRRTKELEQTNRELEIEASIARVRSVAMSMVSPSDMVNVCRTISDELQQFGVEHIRNIQTVIIDEGKNRYQNYQYFTAFDKELIESAECDSNPSVFSMIKSMLESPDAFFTGILDGTDLEAFKDFRRKEEKFEENFLYEADYLDYHFFSIGPGGLGITLYKKISEEGLELFRRYHNVFSLSYQRFRDIEKAEAQTKETKVEASLERVRSKTMAMHHSSELKSVIEQIYKEITILDIDAMAADLLFYDTYTTNFTLWISGTDGTEGPIYVQDFPHSHQQNSYSAWKDGIPCKSTLLKSEDFKTYFERFFHHETGLKSISDDTKSFVTSLGEIYHTEAFTKHGCIRVASINALDDEECSILERFATVFNQTYARFQDLLKAEQQAYESRVEASLERIRALASAMNHSDDLKQIAEAMFKEMEILQIKPLRYGLAMIEENDMKAELWASTVADGKFLNLLGSVKLDWHPMLKEGFEAWEKQLEEYIYTLKGAEINAYYERISKVNPNIKNLDSLLDPKTTIVQFCSFFPFKTGILYAFTEHEPDEEGLTILKRFANVFEQAHIRFEDLQRTEEQDRLIREERDRLEIALNELHATQEQLIQQEKLASLGQLTAGIAHEIKNPLNFVNNFSDLSIELIEETRDELEKDPADTEEALFILKDIEANLKKIHEHGSRADSIVKSMLQHSRGGTGKMEHSNLNSIIKEFVNLSFHGMRASKNPINVDIDLQLDESIPEVPLIAEDFSRVVLNICNNAFDAMREKEAAISAEDQNYKPKLVTKTYVLNGKIRIEFEDNGPGIPEHMVDKITQPFFTTKKGTEGTGLGLSITHDIIKAHGGKLEIDSIESERTIFKIII